MRKQKIYILTVNDEWWDEPDVTYCANKATAERIQREENAQDNSEIKEGFLVTYDFFEHEHYQ